MEIFTVKNLTFTYPETEKPAVSDFSVTVQDGDFFVLCGRSGCGKSTLLRQLKPSLSPHGRKTGEILFCGTPLSALDERTAAAEIGFVLQSPDNQIVTDKVWHELAFGLESLGFDTPTIRRRVSEMASFFGIQNWFHRSVATLSGGQKQLLNLAAVMVMQPRVLILDEPTSQLDPIAASDFLSTLQKINRELGTAIILTEHRLEEALPMATKAAVMEEGRLLCQGTVPEIGAYLKDAAHDMFLAMPASLRIWASVNTDLPCPVSARDGRLFLREYVKEHGLHPVPQTPPELTDGPVAISAKDVWFRYEKELPDTVKGLHLTVVKGQLFCLLGGNGTGKTTTLTLLAGLKKPYRGEINVDGRVCFLPQNPQTLFVKKTVDEELRYGARMAELAPSERADKLAAVTDLCRLGDLQHRHPFDLSGGEQQRLALAKLLLFSPDILLLDEPTKGLDAAFKTEFAAMLAGLRESGITMLMVSHDIEFCAEYADRCALFFDGAITAEDAPHAFFAGNSFYTTAANRMARGIIPDAVTASQVTQALGGKTVTAETAAKHFHRTAPSAQVAKETLPPRLPLWRKIGAGLSGLGALAVFLYATKAGSLTELIDKTGVTAKGYMQLPIYGALIACLVLFALCIGRRSAPPVLVQTPKEKRKLSKRTRLSVVLILLLIPITLFVGLFYLESKQYYLTALAVLVECSLPFFLIFEGRHPKARELVIIAALCAIGVAGRAAFFMLPQFKPVLALTIIAGVAFGGETGFLVGAVTMLVSNIMFSQGPWTPWQMFAMGIIGFLSGILFKKGLLRRTRGALCSFGAISAIVIYGGLMNPVSALLWGSEGLNLTILAGYYLTGFPMDCVHAAATVLFLWFGAQPMLEKLDRIKTKYGLVE